MKFNKVFLMSILSAGLLLSACNTPSSSNKKDASKEETSLNSNDSNVDSNGSNDGNEHSLFVGQVAGFSFKYLDCYVKAVVGELRQDEMDRLNELEISYKESQIVYGKDLNYVWTIGEQRIEGTFTQTGSNIRMLGLRMYYNGNLIQEATPEQAEQEPLNMTLDGEVIDGVMGGGGSGKQDENGEMQYDYRYEYHIKHTLVK